MKTLISLLCLLLVGCAIPGIDNRHRATAPTAPTTPTAPPNPPPQAVSGSARVATLAVPPATNSVTLLWDYPPEELEAALSFNVYEGTSLAVTQDQWHLAANVTNQTITLPVVPGLHLFHVTATNSAAGLESPPSNWIFRPPIAPSGLKINR